MEEHLEIEKVDSLECNICYEIHHNKNETITLECCKGSKKMYILYTLFNHTYLSLLSV